MMIGQSNAGGAKFRVSRICSDARLGHKLSFLIVRLERFRSKIWVFSTPGRLPDPFAATRGTRAMTGPERTLGIAARLGRAAIRLGHHQSYLRDAPAHRETTSRAAILTSIGSCLADAGSDAATVAQPAVLRASEALGARSTG
jgi:hypothetical protein